MSVHIENGEFFILNWLRNRNTIEFLSIWERVYNHDFKPAEFDRIKSQSYRWLDNNERINYCKNMPELSRFLGISILMYFDDHNPPHFHVRYNDDRALISISDLKVLEGHLPARI